MSQCTIDFDAFLITNKPLIKGILQYHTKGDRSLLKKKVVSLVCSN